MSQTYKAKGIVLKGSSLKESDRLVTVLSPEFGLIRAVAPGAKKHKSRLRGRTELFVVNEFLIVSGRSLDKIIQADTIYTYPGLSQDLGKLASAQYLAELCLALALSEQPQIELYELLNKQLGSLEQLDKQDSVYPHLAQAVFSLLEIAGVAPQVYACCLTQNLIPPNLNDPGWRVGFSFDSGGIIDLSPSQPSKKRVDEEQTDEPEGEYDHYYPTINYRLQGMELAFLQQLSRQALPLTQLLTAEEKAYLDLEHIWIRIEKILREYIQYQLGKPIRSATLVDNLYVEF